MTQSDFLRLQRIVVEGLFGTYNHDINLNLHDRVTLLHGPNGVGKTVILGMISALLQERFDYFQRIPFSRFLLVFDDGSTLALQANDETESDDRRFLLTLTRSTTSQSMTVRPAFGADAIAARLEYLHPYKDRPGVWVDIRDGEVLSASEVLSRYGSSLPHAENTDDEGNWFSDFLKNANAHSIEAERLVRMNYDSRGRLEPG